MISRAMKVKMVCAALLGVILLLGGLFWYFRFYTKTPEYALRSIETAMQENDVERFLRYVRLDALLEGGYDDFMEGTLETEFGHSSEASAALEDFSKMLKPAFIKMLQDAIVRRLQSGEWALPDNEDQGADAENILSRVGLRDLSLREYNNLTVDETAHTADVDVLVHQEEADADFTFRVHLAPSEEGDWQVISIENLHEYAAFLGKARRLRMETYLSETNSIQARHDQAVATAQLRLYSVLGAGTLGSQSTRDMARTIMEQDILTDWQTRKEELSSITPPRTMQSLHQLRLKICDLHVAYAEGYAEWMTDKSAATIRAAENSLRQAEVLEMEADFLTKRAKRSFGESME